MKQLSKLALVGALLAATLSAAAAEDRAHDQSVPAFSSQQQNAPQNELNKIDVGENGGA